MSEQRLPCGCYGRYDDHLGGWVITASAFLCERRHNQSDFWSAPHSAPTSATANAERSLPESASLSSGGGAGGETGADE